MNNTSFKKLGGLLRGDGHLPQSPVPFRHLHNEAMHENRCENYIDIDILNRFTTQDVHYRLAGWHLSPTTTCEAFDDSA